jgi:hypothetical protein
MTPAEIIAVPIIGVAGIAAYMAAGAMFLLVLDWPAEGRALLGHTRVFLLACAFWPAIVGLAIYRMERGRKHKEGK